MVSAKIHWIRGTLVLIVLGPLSLLTGIVAIFSLVDAFISGWIPARWLSGNIADWIWGSGQVGDALNYGMFMIGGIIAYGSILAIRWGYFGRG